MKRFIVLIIVFVFIGTIPVEALFEKAKTSTTEADRSSDLSEEITLKLKLYSSKDSFVQLPISTTLRITVPHLVAKAEDIYFASLDYQFLSLRSLTYARHFLNTEDSEKAKEYVQKADRYYKLATGLHRDSLAVLQSSISAAEWIIVYRASRTALGFAVGVVAPAHYELVAHTLFDVGELYTDYLLDTSMIPLDDARRNLLAQAISKVLLKVTGASDLLGDAVKHGWGSSGAYSALEQIIGSSEFKEEVLKEFMRLGGDLGDYVTRKALEELIERFLRGDFQPKEQDKTGPVYPYPSTSCQSSYELKGTQIDFRQWGWANPLNTEYMYVTSFGCFLDPKYWNYPQKKHLGVDLLAESDGPIKVGSPVFSICKGTVVDKIKMSKAYYEDVYLSFICVKCDDNVFIGDDETVIMYGHVRDPKSGALVQVGDEVKAGEQIAEIGPINHKGAWPVPHLHLGMNAKGHYYFYGTYGWGIATDATDEEIAEKGWVDPIVYLCEHASGGHTQVDGLVTAIVMDKSGSMSGEKIRRAKEAAYVYVDTGTEQQDAVSLVAFATDAQSIAEPVPISEGREKLKQDILHVSAGGSTNVGSGLTIALQHLTSSNRTAKKALLMSDGQHNTGTYKPEVAEFQSRGWPIYTVAFGRDADQEMLGGIANQTDGIFYPAEESDIASVYHKINVLAHNGSVYRSYNDFIRTADKLAYDIPVEPDMKKVGFFTNWQGSRMETVLFPPDKKVMNRSNIQNRGKFVEGETHSCYEIDNPQCGTWQALITGYNLPPQGEQVNFHSFCQSDVFSNVLGFQPRYSQNQEVRIGIKLAEVINGRLVPLKGAQVKAEIKKPSISLNKLASDFKRRTLSAKGILNISREISGFSREITLFDDGLHNDVAAGDGIYADRYDETTTNGPYLVTIDCQAHTSQGTSVKRVLEESFQVGPIEQNSFTVSDFLNLIKGKGSSPQLKEKKEEIKEKAVEKVIDTVFDRLFKK